MRALVGATILVVAPLLAAACTGASPDPGIGALIQVSGAQYRPGPFPDDSGGPQTFAIQPDHATVTVGRLHDSLHGQFDRMTTSAIIGVAGADGAWIVPAGPPDLSTTDQPGVTVTYGLQDDAPLGPTTLLLAAGDADGRIGPAASTTVVAAAAPPPTGELVVSLEWTSTADLDLHVVDALGGEAWSDSPNTWQAPPPGEPAPPDDYLTGGILDHDGNADCRRDGLPNEHVVWSMPPPPGDYIVRVDVRMMCGDASAAWSVAAYRDDVLVGAARGVSTDDDAELPNHGTGAGQLALQFSVQ